MDEAPRTPPARFAAGDTLWFVQYFPDYLPANGWSLKYVLTNLAGIEQVNVVSVPTETGDGHLIQQAAFAEALDVGDYILAGYAINAANNYRHQIYYAPLKLTPDLADGLASKPIATYAQRMIAMLEEKLLEMESQSLQETDLQRSRILQENRDKALNRLQYWYEKRFNEIQHDLVRNGQPSGTSPIAVLDIG
jgi:hypothetical protein